MALVAFDYFNPIIVLRARRAASLQRRFARSPVSMSAEHEVLERQNQSLEPQNECVHKRKRIHDVKRDGMKRTSVFRHDRVVIVGIGVGDAAAAGSHAIESTIEQGLQSY